MKIGNLLHHEKFQKAVEIVRKFANGYCRDQSPASNKFVWEIWLVGRVPVMVTGKALPCPRTEDDILVDVWAPVTDSILWADTERAVSELNTPKTTIDGMRNALETIKAARDYNAENAKYPDGLLGPDQCFDDWAADLAEKALETLPPRRVYIYVDGGAVQGVSGPPGTEVFLLDEDNAAVDESAKHQLDEDSKQRDKDEAAGHVVGIF